MMIHVVQILSLVYVLTCRLIGTQALVGEIISQNENITESLYIIRCNKYDTFHVREQCITVKSHECDGICNHRQLECLLNSTAY